MGKDVVYKGQVLTLTLFWASKEGCLWIKSSEQLGLDKMRFVGGHPDEYCIFLSDLTEREKGLITAIDGSPIDIEKELQIMKNRADTLS